MSIIADALDEALGRLERYDYAVAIRATLNSLAASFPVPSTAGSAFERTQNAQLGVIAEMVGPLAKNLAAALDALEADSAAVPDRVRPENAVTAIRTYWRPLIFQWIAAIFIDIAPACLLIILTAAFREIDHRCGRDQSRPLSQED